MKKPNYKEIKQRLAEEGFDVLSWFPHACVTHACAYTQSNWSQSLHHTFTEGQQGFPLDFQEPFE